MTDNKVVDIILHCQKQIKKERLPEEKLLHYLGRLSRLRVTVQDLADTGIGRTVNSLSRNEGPVGQAADTLVRGWKRMVSEQQNQAERESEEESDSNSNSGSSEEEEEEEEANNGEPEPYEIDDQAESRSQERRYSNGHSSYEELRAPPTEVPPPHQNRGYDDDAADEEDLNDDIDDPYMENGFLSMTNVHSDGEDEEEDEIDDAESVGSERLEIDAEEDDNRAHQRSEEKPPSFIVKQERQPLDEREQKSSHSSKSSSSLKSHESDHKKHSSNSSSSKSHRNHERSSDKSQSKEHKHNHHRSSSKSRFSPTAAWNAVDSPSRPSSVSSSKDRSSSKQSSSNVDQHSSSQTQQKSHHSSSSSKPEKLKEPKSEHEKSHQHKEKDRHHRSKESSSSHRDKEKEVKTEKERSSREKKDSNDHRSSNSSSSSHKDKTKIRDHASSSQSPKKSSLETNIKKEPSSQSSSQEDRKRKEHSLNSPSDSSANKKSKLVLKEEIDSNSGINFADVLGSLDTSSGSTSTKHGSSKKDKRKEEHDRGHRKHHDSSHHSSSSSSKKHGSSSSKHSSSSRDAGSSSSSSKKYDRDSEVVKLSKKAIPPQSKIESVIQPVVNISPNYKPMSSSLAKLARPSAAISSSGNGNGIVAAPSIPLSHADLSDLATVDFWDNAEKGESSQLSQEDAISVMLSNRNARSKVYSGVKSGRKAEVSSLFDLCMQVIKDNIGDLGFTGGIPYDILKPALERANPQQLISIESQNDYLIGETDELWQFHCKRDFRGKFPVEESWRELYERCTEERQQKFEVVKNKMKRTIERAEPVRKAKLAYVDTTSTTRFNRQKAQTIKNGMKTLKIKEEKGPSRGVSSSASAGFNNPKKSGDANTVVLQEAAVIIAPESRAGHAPAPSVSRETSAAKLKPKKAPLMQKTMKLVKSLQRR